MPGVSDQKIHFTIEVKTRDNFLSKIFLQNITILPSQELLLKHICYPQNTLINFDK